MGTFLISGTCSLLGQLEFQGFVYVSLPSASYSQANRILRDLVSELIKLGVFHFSIFCQGHSSNFILAYPRVLISYIPDKPSPAGH